METIVIGCCVNAGLMAVADLSAQRFEYISLRKNAQKVETNKDPQQQQQVPAKQEINIARTVRFSGVGLLVTGPLMVLRYSVLNMIFSGGDVAVVAVEKMLFNQFVFDPPDTILRMGVLEYARSRDVRSVDVKLRRDYWLVQVPAWMVSIPSNLFTFYMIPTVWGQIVVHRCISTCFQVYFSYVANRAVTEGSTVPMPTNLNAETTLPVSKSKDVLTECGGSGGGAAEDEWTEEECEENENGETVEEVKTVKTGGWRGTQRCDPNTDIQGGEHSQKALPRKKFFFDLSFLKAVSCWSVRH